MINLRFHIVSIIAVFLALALGIFTGTSLLDRATVDFIDARQRSLDTRNKALRAENDRFRTVVETSDAAETAFGEGALPDLVAGRLDGVSVVVLASRGIDEDSVDRVSAVLAAAGARPNGVVWLGTEIDPSEAARLGALATLLGFADDTADASTVIAALAAELAPLAVGPQAGASTSDQTSTTSAATSTSTQTSTSVPGVVPAGGVPAAPQPDPPRQISILRRLVGAGLVQWDRPDGVEVADLDAGVSRVVILSGEGADVAPQRLVLPLVRAMAAQVPGVVVGEIRRPRTGIELADQADVPRRGSLVDPLRDSDVADRLVTIDNLDAGDGRLALILALARIDETLSGHFGEAESAERDFPGPAA